MPNKIRDLVQFATLAANGHNTQPWKFAVGENAVEIHPDYTRRLAIVDPQDRELWISLGCALENLLVAARSFGYSPHVTYPGDVECIQIHLIKDAPLNSLLFNALTLRQNTRSVYDGRPIPAADLDKVQALMLEPGVQLHFVTNPEGLKTVKEYTSEGNQSQYSNPTFVDELLHWLRFNRKEALASQDGLYTRALGNPEVPRWLGKMFVSRTKMVEQADSKKWLSSSGAVIVASESEDKTAWVRTGQVYERMALTLTTLDIKSALMNQPLEVVELRSQFQTAIGLGARLPQLLVRYGYANAMSRSLRRPVEQVLFQP